MSTQSTCNYGYWRARDGQRVNQGENGSYVTAYSCIRPSYYSMERIRHDADIERVVKDAIVADAAWVDI